MNPIDLDGSAHLPEWPERRDAGIGVVGAGFIVRDCHLVAYAEAGFRVVGITSRTRGPRPAKSPRCGESRASIDSVEAMLDDPEVEVVDVAVPPAEQPGVIRRILGTGRQGPGHPGAEAAGPVDGRGPRAWSRRARRRASCCRSTRTCGTTTRSGRLKHLLDRGRPGRAGAGDDRDAGDPALDALGRGGPVALDVHHEHPPPRHVPLLAGRSRPRAGQHPARPADRVPARRRHQPLHPGIRRRALGPRPGTTSGAGPCARGRPPEIGIRWRFEGTEGLALGTIGWPGWPDRVPSTLDYSTRDDQGAWHRPRWPEAWFPDAFAGTMAGLLRALETGTEPDISGRDNLEDDRPLRGGPGRGEGAPRGAARTNSGHNGE